MKPNANHVDHMANTAEIAKPKSGQWLSALLCLLGFTLAVPVGLFLVSYFRPIEDIMDDEKLDWVLEGYDWKGHQNYVLTFSGSGKADFCLRFEGGDFFERRGCYLRKGKAPIEKEEVGVDPNIVHVVSGSRLEDAVLRVLGQALRKELRVPFSLPMAERVGSLLVVSDRLKLPHLGFGEAGRLSFGQLKTLPPEVLEMRLYGTREETEAMIRKIEEESP